MASTILGETHIGGKRVSWGTFDCLSTTDEITTGLSVINNISVIVYSATAVVADEPVIYETFPKASDGITVNATTTSTGYWMAFGY